MAVEQTTGVYLLSSATGGKPASFPREFRRGFFKRFEARFWLLFIGCLSVIGSVVFILSFQEVSETISDKEIERIQERYAQLVLKQPKPKVEEEKPAVEEVVEETAAPEEPAEKEEEKIDREKETYEERQERKQETRVERRKRREEIKKQVQTTGIFAAITASGGGSSGSSAGVTDILGAVGETDDLENINISKGTFATRKTDPEALKARRGKTTSDVDIEKEEVSKVRAARMASKGDVRVSAKQPAQISGNEDGGSANRSQASILRVINRETSRLKRIYEYWLKKDPALGGQIKIKFSILPSGAVANVSIVTSTTGNDDFDRSILRYVKRWEFPADPGGGPVEVVYPFVFEGSR